MVCTRAGQAGLFIGREVGRSPGVFFSEVSSRPLTAALYLKSKTSVAPVQHCIPLHYSESNFFIILVRFRYVISILSGPL